MYSEVFTIFFNYNISGFSNYLKELRTSLNLSRSQVSKLSKINIDTIRNIENGSTLPRLDTLLILSRVYKENLILKLNEFLNNNENNRIYCELDKAIMNFDKATETLLINEFFKNYKNENISCIDYLELEQFKNLLDVFKKEDLDKMSNEETNKCILYLLNTLKLNNPNLNIENISSFRYTYLEKRILYSIAYFMFKIDLIEESNNILNALKNMFIVKYDPSVLEIRLYIKILALLSYNYYILDNIPKSLKVANLGIELCESTGFIDNLNLLYFRKSMSLLHLHLIKEAQLYFDKSILVLKLKDNSELIDLYTLYFTKKINNMRT